MRSDDDLAALLCRVPLFAALDEGERAVVHAVMRPVVFKAGDTLLRQGAPSDGLYVIAEGQVVILVRLPGDDEVALSLLGPGDVLGEMALVDRQSRSASVRAVTETRAWFLNGRWFDAQRAQLEPSSFTMLRQLALLLCGRLRRTNERLVDSPAGSEETAGQSDPPPSEGARAADTSDQPLLRVLPIFRDFADDELMALARRMRRHDLPRGRVVFSEGEPGDCCFIILWGAVEVSVERGTKRRLAIRGPGKIFGHVALLDGGLRSATCTARENAVLLKLDRAEVERVFAEGGPVAFKLMDMLLCTLIGAQREADAALARLFALEQVQDQSSVHSERG